MVTDLPDKIAPENLTVANTYLIYGNIPQTANSLAMTELEVSEALRAREVKRYIDHQYLDAGYRNRDKIASALDSVIQLKLEEMEETEMGSSKDIADLLQLAHKMRMDEMKVMTEQEKPGPVSQTNVLITESGGVNYNKLLGKIYNGS